MLFSKKQDDNEKLYTSICTTMKKVIKNGYCNFLDKEKGICLINEFVDYENNLELFVISKVMCQIFTNNFIEISIFRIVPEDDKCDENNVSTTEKPYTLFAGTINDLNSLYIILDSISLQEIIEKGKYSYTLFNDKFMVEEEYREKSILISQFMDLKEKHKLADQISQKVIKLFKHFEDIDLLVLNNSTLKLILKDLQTYKFDEKDE
jgi:hypothetical protein